MDYKPDHRGIGRLLVGHDMAHLVDTVTQQGAQYAHGIAPVETGEYAGSFEVATEVIGDRATGVLANTSDHAAAVERGTEDTAGDHVLARTIDWIEAGG